MFAHIEKVYGTIPSSESGLCGRSSASISSWIGPVTSTPGTGCGVSAGTSAETSAGTVSSASTAVNGSAHSQQSLQRLHRAQRWFRQVSLVQYAQISEDGSRQMLHAKTTVPAVIFSPASVPAMKADEAICPGSAALLG